MDKYIPSEIEDKWYSFWTEKGYFKADNTSKKPPFSIVIPPPNVTGSLHMGHALNNTLQDIICRHKRAKGYNVLWVPGCDHAGIATQNVVERELKKEGKKKSDIGREEFLKRVWEWKDKYGKTIMMQLRKLGSSCDWSRERFTMDEGLSKAVKEVFVDLYKEGLIYRGDYIVNWCPRCLTAISDIEVQHKEIDGHFYHIRYPYADGSGYIEVATTRPETMFGDTAVAVHPDDPRYANVKEGTMLILPETGRQIPVIKDTYVDREFGTGAVKITPAHDPNDFEMGIRHKLPVINVMTDHGKMNENAGVKYSGMDRFEARKKLVEALKEQGHLVKIDDMKHAVGHCYRCDTIVEPYISTQWYVKIKPIAEKAIEVVEKGEVQFVPDMWRKVYFEWMHNIKDWCISRQLWWGHRIPAWYCDDCKHITVSKDTPVKCEKCGSAKIHQDNDVLDTWFSSGLWPFSTLGWPEKTKDLEVFYPTSVLVTSWDILFFWVARMIMGGTKFMGKAPFSYVVINSLITDSEGKKMSKSKGNVVDPLVIMEKYSADALRFTMASIETQSRYIAFSEERAKGNASFMNKIFNASKYTISNIERIKEIDLEVNADKLKLPEKWILSASNEMCKYIDEGIEKFKFSDTALSIYEFFWHTFCDWYIEISKIELTKENNEEYKNIVKNVLLKVLKDSIVVMHPYIPFITEEIYQNLPSKSKKESIMLEQWPGYVEKFNFDKNELEVMDDVMKVIYSIRNLRGELDFSPAVKVDVYVKMTKKQESVDKYIDIIRTLAKVNEIIKAPTERLIIRDVTGAKAAVIGCVGIDRSAVVDKAKIIANKEKKIAEIQKGMAASANKLNNPNFVNNAMKKAIEEEKAKLAGYEADKKALLKFIEELKK